MALVSTTGLGSGLDISGMVSQLVAAERAAPDAALNRREARTKAQISAIGQVKSAFSQLQTALNKLQADSTFSGRKVTSADEERLTARVSAGTTPALATYSIEVESLAAAQKLQSAATAAPATTTELGTGTLSFSVGDASFDVEVTDSNNTIYSLAAAINSASGGKVQAAVVRGDAGYSLSITSTKAGTAGEISIEQTAGGSSLAAFTFDADTPPPGSMSEITAASDAVFYVDGVKRTSSSNVVTDAIDGVELTLKKAELTATFNLTVGEDNAASSSAVQGFVTAYNNVLGTLATVSAFNLEAKTAAALNGDAFVRSATSQLRNYIGEAFSSAAEAGVKMGIDTGVDGKLTFNAAQFSNALEADPTAIKSLFAGETATLSQGLSGFVDGVLSDSGTLTQRGETLSATLKTVTRERDALDRRMLSIEERYRKQFTALDSLLGKLNNTSQYLAQQLAGLSAGG